MMSHLLLNENRKSRGTSSIIASIFVVLVVLLLSSSILIQTTNKNSAYFQEISAGAQDDAELVQERLVTSYVTYYVQDDKVLISCSIRNDFSSMIQIINLWIHDTTITKYGYNETININLRPGDTIIFNESNTLSVKIEGSSSSHTFMSWFVTARGNIIPLKEELRFICIHDIIQGIINARQFPK